MKSVCRDLHHALIMSFNLQIQPETNAVGMHAFAAGLHNTHPASSYTA